MITFMVIWVVRSLREGCNLDIEQWWFSLVGLIIPELKDHMICFKLERSHSNALVENVIVKKNPLQDLLSSLIAVISTNERNRILTGHVTFKLPYNKIYQLKTPNIILVSLFCY